MFISLGGNCSVCYQLNKYNIRTVAYPFDWCKISINQLISVLSNDFDNYDSIKIYKYSENHNSYLLKNDYDITFAHEIGNIDEFKIKLADRIDRFKNSKNNIYIRIELCKINDNYINKIKQLMKLIKGKLILIINSDIEINIENVVVYRYNEFSDDWQMNHIDWLTIFKYFYNN